MQRKRHWNCFAYSTLLNIKVLFLFPRRQSYCVCHATPWTHLHINTQLWISCTVPIGALTTRIEIEGTYPQCLILSHWCKYCFAFHIGHWQIHAGLRRELCLFRPIICEDWYLHQSCSHIVKSLTNFPSSIYISLYSHSINILMALPWALKRCFVLKI